VTSDRKNALGSTVTAHILSARLSLQIKHIRQISIKAECPNTLISPMIKGSAVIRDAILHALVGEKKKNA
jgi:hypothetical protein